MCDPTGGVATLAIAMLLTAGAGAYQADAQKKAGEYQAEIDKQNADLNDFKAGQVAEIGAIQEEQHRAKVRQMAGTQRANLAANGIDLGSGTAQDIVDETYTLGEADALTIRFNAMNEAWGYRVAAQNDRNHAAFALTTGKNQARGTYLSTAASLASMAGGFGGGGGGGGGGAQITTYSTPTNQSARLTPSYSTYRPTGPRG